MPINVIIEKMIPGHFDFCCVSSFTVTVLVDTCWISVELDASVSTSPGSTTSAEDVPSLKDS